MDAISPRGEVLSPSSMAQLMRELDWTRSPLGPPEGWPSALRTVVSLMLESRYPMFVAWGPELGFIYNDAYAIILGARHPQALGRRFHDIWADIWTDIEPLIARALGGEASFMEDMYLLMHRNGYPEETWYSFSYSPLRDETGRIGGMFCACMETTQKVLAERNLKHLNDELETRVAQEVAERMRAEAALHQAQKLETIGQLTGGVAHDFNNLLTPIVYALDMQRRRGSPDPMLQQLVEGAARAAERARLLVQRLLSFARRQHLRPRPIDVASLVRRSAELMLRSLGPRIQLDLQVAEGLAPALVDPSQLELALLNLAVNARDAMEGNGKLSIRVQADDGAAAGLAAGEYLRISVTDNGCGMDAATLKRATEPFFTTKETGRGTGLGLSSVQGLALQSGGGFALESVPGQGTVATLWLPASDEPAEPVPEPDHEDSPPLAARSAMVLLVDDEALVRAGSRHMLGEAGHAVVEATSAVEALQLLRAGLRVDILVTDYAMPGMSGSRLAEEARKLQPGLPVLLVTGYANLDDAEAERLPRLAKPYSAAGLAHAVAKLLG